MINPVTYVTVELTLGEVAVISLVLDRERPDDPVQRKFDRIYQAATGIYPLGIKSIDTTHPWERS